MSDGALWEEQFVNSYIQKSKRTRYLTFLKGKKRQQILDRLNHTLDFVEAKATELDGRYRSSAALYKLLRGYHVSDTCYLVADGNDLDGNELAVESGVEELLDNHFGAVLICPPNPIAVYKEEVQGRLMILA